MTNREREEAMILLGTMAEAIGQEVSTARLLLLLEDLDDVPFDLVKAAIATARKTCKFIPSPSELRDLAWEEGRKPRPLPALPPVDAEAEKERVRASWRGKTAEVKELCEKLPKGPARAMAEKLATKAGA